MLKFPAKKPIPSSGKAGASGLPVHATRADFGKHSFRSRSPANPAKPTFKGTGMKLGKKGKQSDFLAAVEDLPVPVKVPDVHAGQSLSEPAQPFQTDDGHNPAIHEYVKACYRRRPRELADDRLSLIAYISRFVRRSTHKLIAKGTSKHSI
jgi:hypothetical protein